jgi:hypothetical protein
MLRVGVIDLFIGCLAVLRFHKLLLFVLLMVIVLISDWIAMLCYMGTNN